MLTLWVPIAIALLWMSLRNDKSGLQPPLDVPKWVHTPEEILQQAKAYVESEKKFHDHIASIEQPTVENVLIPTAERENSVYLDVNQLTFYQHVSPDKAVRDALTEAEQLIEEAEIELNLRVDVFKVYNKLWEDIKDKNVTDAESLKLLKKQVLLYKRNGLDLPEATRKEVTQLKKELSNLSVAFGKNMNEEKGFLLFTKEQLDGLPESLFEQFEKDGDKFKVTFKYPDILPVLKYAKDSEVRKMAHLANLNKVPQNADLLDKIIRVRFKLAKLLGYPTYSAFVLEERMAKNQDNVFKFLGELQEKLQPQGKAELERLREFKKADLKERGLPPQDDYYAWDHSFYDNLLLEKQYKVDHQKISEFFPLDQTIERMLGFYEHLFDVKFVKVDNTDSSVVWHEDVQRFAVFQNIAHGAPKNEFCGWILFDLHPREGKYSHAAMFGLKAGYISKDGSRLTPYCLLVCNFTKATKTKPSLLKHSEVTTFFHELGHGVHSLMSKTRYARFHGTAVPRDFVECPSQMLEFWTWSKNEIKALLGHYVTHEPIGDELVDQLVALKHVNTGLSNLRQLHFALFDMKLHTAETQAQLDAIDIKQLWNLLREEITLISNGGTENIGFATFGHIAGGYESGYYGYLYSQVFATDIYYTHFKKDPMNVESGLRYRDVILRNGDSKEILDILEELLGRPPNANAFMEEILAA